MITRRDHGAGWLPAIAGALRPPVFAALVLSLALVPGPVDAATPSLALLPALAVYRWAKQAPVALVCPLAAIGGASLDALAHGPLGYWALVYAAAAALGANARGLPTGQPVLGLAMFGLDMAVLTGLQAGLTLVCTLAPPDGAAIAGATLIAIAAYPVMALLMGAVTPPPRGASR